MTTMTDFEMTNSSCTTSKENNYCIPHEFICPLTLETMVNPLMDRSGRSFERKAILEWITTKNSICPITRQPLFVKDLVPNNKLRTEIMCWREQNGDDTQNLSLDDTIQIEEITRALQHLGRKNFDFKKAKRHQRSHNSGNRHHHHHHDHDDHSGISNPTLFRFMRIFNR
jgi:U-box domain